VGLSGRRQNAHIADTLHLRHVAMATPFCLLTGYNFGCMIASDTLFDSKVGFPGQAIWWRHSRFRGSKGCCHGNHFWLSIYGVYIGATWRIRLNRPCAAAMRPYVKLLWPLVYFYFYFYFLSACLLVQHFCLDVQSDTSHWFSCFADYSVSVWYKVELLTAVK